MLFTARVLPPAVLRAAAKGNVVGRASRGQRSMRAERRCLSGRSNLAFAFLLFAILGATGCGQGGAPSASIPSAPVETEQMKAAKAWLIGGWDGKVVIDRDAVKRTEGVTDAHVAGIEAARMQFQFQREGKVAMSASVPTTAGPAARNAMAEWTILQVKGNAVTLRIEHDDQPNEQVVVQRLDENTFTMAAPQNLGVVRFSRL